MDSVVDPTTLTAQNIRVTDSSGSLVSGSAIVNPLDSTVVWTANAPLGADTYEVRLVSGIGGITDLAGNPLDGATGSSFAFPNRSGDASAAPADFVASITVSGPDATAASVIGNVRHTRDPYNASQFRLFLNDQLSMRSVHTTDFRLRGEGSDQTFGTADDPLIPLDATYDSITSKNNRILYLYSRGVVDTGNYRIEATLLDAAGNTVQLMEPVSVGGTVPDSALSVDSAGTTIGLTGSYINSNLVGSTKPTGELRKRSPEHESTRRSHSDARTLECAPTSALPADRTTTTG